MVVMRQKSKTNMRVPLFKEFINEVENHPLIKNSVGDSPTQKDTGNSHNIKDDNLIASIQDRLDNCIEVIESVIYDCEKVNFSPEKLNDINSLLTTYINSIKGEFEKPDKSNI